MKRHIHRSGQIELTHPSSIERAITKDEAENEGGAEVRVRLASQSDATILARLRYDFRSSLAEVREDDGSFVQRCRLWMRDRLHGNSSWKCWIAESKQTVLGNLWAQLIEKIPNPTSEPEYHIYITNLYVRKDCRGNGIGSMLLSAALAWSQTTNVHAAILWPTRESLSFYLRHGFSVRGDLMELIIGLANDESADGEDKPCQP